MRNPSFFSKQRVTAGLVIILLVFSSCAAASVITPLTFNGTMITHDTPDVFGNLAVWSDNREGKYATYLYDMITGTETRISSPVSYTPQKPRISGNQIVYQDDSAGGPDIYLYNTVSATTVPITWDPLSSHLNPIVSDGRVVWEDYRSGTPTIYLNDTRTWTESVVSPTDSGQMSPDISGDLVVWMDNRNTIDWDIFLYDLMSGSETQVTNDPSNQMYPAVDGNRIVWTDDRNGMTSEIYINGTAPGLEYSLTPDGGAANHEDPAIHGTKVVWQQETSAIYLNDTSLSSSSLIPVDTMPGSIPDVPKISTAAAYGDRVVWKEGSTNDIYLYTSGSSSPCPVSNYTHDFNGGPAPVTVRFTDRSAPAGATHWLWDFGDGSTSTLQNPSHRYTDNSSYDVSLTTGNPYCRNKTVETGSVVIGRPVADFTASPRSDIVPAVITFTDRSRGSPAVWLWDFGDGDSSSEQNPVHTYSTVGTYTVSMTATNAYGSSVRTRTGYISVLKGANRIANTTIDGLAITNCAGPQSITVTKAVLTSALTPNSSVLELNPPPDRGFDKITVYAFDGVGFEDTGTTIMGNVTGVLLETEVIHPQGFSDTIGGSHIAVSYSTWLASYPCNALLRTAIWEDAVAEDKTVFQKIALDSHFAHYSGTAYTTRVTKTNFPAAATGRFRMSVNSDWVASFTDGRNQTFLERISDDRAFGEVLDTRFVSEDPVNNVDYFEAESPHGLSTFGLSALSGSGNPLQLITLTVTSHVPPSSPVSESSDSDTGGAGGGKGAATVSTPTPTPTPVQTRAPPDFGKSAKVYTNPQGVVSQETRLPSTDGRAIISLPVGIVAKDASGKPLTEITIIALPSENLPAIPAGSTFTFAGMAYEIGPDGATFSPPASLTFTIPQAQWGEDYSVKSFDQKSGTWQDLPMTIDAATGAVTVQVSHFCCFALFTQARALSYTPAETPLPLPPAPQVKAQPPTTAVSIFMSMAGWVADLVANNLIPFVAFIFLGAAGYLVMLGRSPGSGQ